MCPRLGLPHSLHRNKIFEGTQLPSQTVDPPFLFLFSFNLLTTLFAIIIIIIICYHLLINISFNN